MTDIRRVAQLRREILDHLPDAGKTLFHEYNELISSTLEKMNELNNEQDRLLKKVAFRTDN